MPTKQILNLGTGGVSYDTPKVLLPEQKFLLLMVHIQ